MVIKKWLPLMAILLVSLSCTLLTQTATQQSLNQPPGMNAETSIAGTLAYNHAVQTAVAANMPIPGSQAVIPPAQPLSPTTQPPTVEPTQGPPSISVSVDTNCREGPGQIYKDISFLLVGKTSEVVKKYQNGLWWVIKDPSNPGRYCWLWGNYATVTGDWQKLPEATQPPTPTANLIVQLALLSVTPQTYMGACPASITGAGTVTVNMPSTVSVTWENSFGVMATSVVTFTAPGTQNISFSMAYVNTFSDDVRMHVTSPVDVYSGAVPFSIVCTP